MNLRTPVIAGSSGVTGAILAAIIAVEGGYVNNPLDPGGETNYGISEPVARQYGYKGPMSQLPLQTAKEIYLKKYIEEPKFLGIVQASPALGHKIVDAGVNVGTKRASVWLQKALNAYSQGGQLYPYLKEDGSVGKLTMAAYEALNKKRGTAQACKLLIKAIDSYQGSYYLSLGRLNMFTAGWMNNRVQNIPLSQCDNYRYN